MKRFPGITLQEDPPVYLAVIPGRWLLKNSTPSWRIKKPEKGFQRMVPERRAREIAAAVLDQGRGFPNAIVIATISTELRQENCKVLVPAKTRFLVVDGQHRLYAQKFSAYRAFYACVIHVGLTLPQMASLFIEINDTQKRVPSSLRWDLVRLVRPETDRRATRASDLVEGLNSDERSPLFQRIDMTGEQPQITIKQGSLAPEIKSLLRKRTLLKEAGLEIQLEALMKFFAAIRERAPNSWSKREGGPLYGNRVFRALLKLLPEMLAKIQKREPAGITPDDFFPLLRRIQLASLSDEALKSTQGNAGIAAITRTLREQIL